ncbi:MAG: pseudouridine synthase [Candidatus Marinamargulisbacteria bacterium]
MKLQHYLSKRGVFSRRVADAMINAGYVSVNNEITTHSLQMISETDQVSFHPKIKTYAKGLGVIKMNKPRNIWTNCKQGNDQKELVDLLPKKYAHYSSIGRLDKASEGLILLTNDGVFANSFLNSGIPHKRVYYVWTKAPLSMRQQRDLSSGIQLTDGLTLPCKIMEIKKNQYEFHLFEGRNRQIRRMIEWCGTHVTKLKRLAFGDHILGGMVPGQYQFKSLESTFFERVKNAGVTY